MLSMLNDNHVSVILVQRHNAFIALICRSADSDKKFTVHSYTQ